MCIRWGMGVRYSTHVAMWRRVAATIAAAACYSAALAQPASSPARVDERLRPKPAPPSVGAPIQITPAPLQAPPPAAGGVQFALHGVSFEGNTVLPQRALQAVAAPYVGQAVTLAQVNELAGRVTAAYRSAGYILVRAVVPPQQFGDGRLTLRIIEGFIDNVKIQGDAGGARGLLEAYGRRISAARPLTRGVLERELLLASDITGLGVRSVLTPSATASGAADLTLVVTPKAVDGYAAIDDRGSRYLGPEQVTGAVFFNQVLGTAGRLGFNAVATPDNGPDLAYGAVSLDEPLGSSGLRLFGTASYTATRPGSVLRALGTIGSALNVEGQLSYPVIRSRDLNLMATGGFAYRDVRSSNSAASPLFNDHVRSLDVGLFANALDDWSGYSTLSVSLIKGLDALGATTSSSANKSRVGASGDYTRLTFEATHLQPLTDRLSLLLGVSGQSSFNESLLSSEQYSLGGYAYDRAFDPSEATGDSGLAGRAELQWRATGGGPAVSSVQPYGFYEGGQVWQAAALPGTPSSQSLYSAGVGVRFAVARRINADLEWSTPLGPDVALTGNRNARAFFSVSTNF
jgi:hemolysin activation/secretion protein